MKYVAAAPGASGSTWTCVAPCDHGVQLYEGDEGFVDTLAHYVANGLAAGEGIVVIATAVHRTMLERELESRGLNLEAARRRDQYVSVDAEESLAQILVDGWPDERRFDESVTALVSRARGRKNRRVRAFGEMAVLLWNRGHHGATVRLEHLCRRICQLQSFALFCAYPKHAFTERTHASLLQIRASHTHVIPG